MKNKFNFPLFAWHLELASECALSCPRCPRTGEANKFKYEVTEMPFEKIKSVLNSEILKMHTKKILLCGGQGDPIYYSKLCEFISYVKDCNQDIEITIVTNGSYRKKDWWETLATVLTERDRIVFSVDGWDQKSNEIYRKGSDFESIMLGIDTMSRSRAIVHWSTIIFSFNQDRLTDIENLAKEKGVNYFHLVKSTKFGTAWANEEGVDLLKPRDEFLVEGGPYVRSLIELNPKKQEFHDLSKEISLRTVRHGNLNPRCVSGNKSNGLYIDASGYLYACSWISHPHDMPLNPGQKNIWLEDKNRFNVFRFGLEQVLNDDIWNDLINSWKSPELTYAVCKEKCSC